MLNRTARLFTTVTRAVRSVVAPAALIREQATVAQTATQTTEPAGLYTADELPPLADIERAALGYDLATDNARTADRAKRKHRRLLDRLPAGTYGRWQISRKPSSRQVADLDAIRAIFAAHNLGPVPMRTVAPSLVVTRATEQPADAEPVLTAA